MTRRYFTVEEAGETLAQVRPLAERMVARRRAQAEAASRRALLAAAIAGNGGRIERRELQAAEAELERAAADLARCVSEIHELGAVVKDVDRGLVDFPARRGGEEVCLCWLVGEESIGYWHGLEDGFAGRRPLPLED